MSIIIYEKIDQFSYAFQLEQEILLPFLHGL